VALAARVVEEHDEPCEVVSVSPACLEYPDEAMAVCAEANPSPGASGSLTGGACARSAECRTVMASFRGLSHASGHDSNQDGTPSAAGSSGDGGGSSAPQA